MRSTTKTALAELTPREQAFIHQVTEEHNRWGYPLDILSVRDAEDITKIPKDTIREWIDRGAIRAWAVCGSPKALRVSLGEVRAASAGIHQARQKGASVSELQALRPAYQPLSSSGFKANRAGLRAV